MTKGKVFICLIVVLMFLAPIMGYSEYFRHDVSYLVVQDQAQILGTTTGADGTPRLLLGPGTTQYGETEDKGIVIDETKSGASRAAAIDLIPSNADRNAIIRFWPEQDTAVEDVTMQAHKEVSGTTHQHFQIHTKTAAGTGMSDRFSIEYMVDVAKIEVARNLAYLSMGVQDTTDLSGVNAGEIIFDNDKAIKWTEASGPGQGNGIVLHVNTSNNTDLRSLDGGTLISLIPDGTNEGLRV